MNIVLSQTQTALSQLMITVTPQTLRNVLDDMGKDFDIQVRKWSNCLAGLLEEHSQVCMLATDTLYV
jgi:hypothetical protein